MKNLGLITKTAGAALVLAAGLMTGCGSSSGGSSAKTGTFEDAAVAGISYSTATQSGTTDADGKFKFKAGETVTFNIGSKISFSGIPQGTVITPAHLAGTADWENDTTALNIIRFLMSVDEDQDPSNGIQIPEGLAAFADTDIDADSVDFSEDLDAQFTEFLADLSIELDMTFTLVSEADAKTHFNATITALGIDIEIQISSVATACTAGNTAEIEGQYNAVLTATKGTRFNGERPVTIDGTELSFGDDVINEDSCTYVQTQIDAIKIGDEVVSPAIVTSTWAWSKGSDVYTINKTMGKLSISIIEADGKEMGTGTLALAPL